VKVGDLVTLSQYGRNLEAFWRFRRDICEGKMVGMLIDIYDDGDWHFKGEKYKVMWLSEKYSKLKRMYWMTPGIFKRNDLKVYRAPKKKKENG
jgi:hypothetical protein